MKRCAALPPADMHCSCTVFRDAADAGQNPGHGVGSNPQISPDGSEVVYTRGGIVRVNDRRESSLWIMPQTACRIAHRWTDQVPISRPMAPGSQLFALCRDMHGPATQIARLEHSPLHIVWSHDGERIVFTALEPNSKEWSIDLPANQETPSGPRRLALWRILHINGIASDSMRRASRTCL